MNYKVMLLLFVFPFVSSVMLAQQKIYQVKADSVRIFSNCDTAELILENRTRSVLNGVLTNKGNGVTEFRKLLIKINDSTYTIGGDSLKTGVAGNQGDSNSLDWRLQGNTVSGLNILGTLDNFDLPFITNSIERLRITAGGSVGIGTTTPAEKLDVNGNFRFSGALLPNNSPGFSGQVLTSRGSNTAPVWLTPAPSLNFANANLIATGSRQHNGAGFDYNHYNINNYQVAGKNGSSIGITSFSSQDADKINLSAADITGLLGGSLHLEISPEFSTGFRILREETQLFRVVAQTGAVQVSYLAGAGNRLIFTDPAGYMIALPNGADNQVLTMVGGFPRWATTIGTPGWNLAGNSGLSASNFLGTTDNSSLRLRTNNIERILIDNSGKVGIGTATPAEKLDVAGNIKTIGFIMPTNAAAGYALTSDANGNASWQSPGTPSDFNLKENISLSQFNTGKLLNLPIKDFNYKTDKNKTRYTGLIAQELKMIIPELVMGKEGNYSIDYIKMMPYLLKAFQDQQLLIEGQQKEIDRLKKMSAAGNNVSPDVLAAMGQLQQQLLQQQEEIKLIKEQVRNK